MTVRTRGNPSVHLVMTLNALQLRMFCPAPLQRFSAIGMTGPAVTIENTPGSVHQGERLVGLVAFDAVGKNLTIGVRFMTIKTIRPVPVLFMAI